MKLEIYSTSQYKALDQLLMAYRFIDNRIARRKLEIETKHHTDINIGGGRSNRVNKRTEWLVGEFDTDTRIKSLEANKEAVNELLSVLNDELLTVFNQRWIGGKSWEEIQEQLNYSSLKLKRVKYSILNQLAFILGWG